MKFFHARIDVLRQCDEGGQASWWRVAVNDLLTYPKFSSPDEANWYASDVRTGVRPPAYFAGDWPDRSTPA
jgi:hypothetical protein